MAKIPEHLREIQIISKGSRERILHPEGCSALRRYGIRLLGVSQATPPFHFSRLRPDMMQILVGLSGKGLAWVDGEWRRISSGQAYLTPAHVPHAYKASRDWEIGWCMFEPAIFPDFQSGPILREINPAPWKHILLGLCEESAGLSDGYQLECWAELLHRQCAKIVAVDEPQRLWRVWNQVREEMHAPWTLAMLAKKAGLSIETLRLQCHRELRMSPMAYLTRLRMRHAAALLETGLKVDYVARQVGYENAFAFSTAFRRAIGVPPSSLKRNPRAQKSSDPSI